MKIAILGLGIIGSRAGARLAQESAHEVRLWNRTTKHLPHEVETLEEATRDIDVVGMYLQNSPAVRDVVSQFVPLLPAGTILANHSTIDLETTRWIEEQSATHGWRFLDAPFTGSREAAETGQLVYYAGGCSDLIETIRPLWL
ncbi:MAG: NAD(P)-binding domain-containing protein, partial [Verrucomicrobiales bacterium]